MIFASLRAKLLTNQPKIVFTDSLDPRVLKVVARLVSETLVQPILVGSEVQIQKLALELGVSLSGIVILDPTDYPHQEALVTLMKSIRGDKITIEEARSLVVEPHYFATLLVKSGVAAGFLGGSLVSTAKIIRPALQLIGRAPNTSLVSSAFLMRRDQEYYLMGDCALNVNPNAQELSEIAIAMVELARLLKIDPRVAILSYSTAGSGKGEDVTKMQEVTELLHQKGVDFPFLGEVQFDAATDQSVAKIKVPDHPLGGNCNIFLFPNLSSGNIGYKIAQNWGGMEAIGPILLGLSAPVNDLSRGCSEEDIYHMAIITAAFVK